MNDVNVTPNYIFPGTWLYFRLRDHYARQNVFYVIMFMWEHALIVNKPDLRLTVFDKMEC